MRPCTKCPSERDCPCPEACSAVVVTDPPPQAKDTGLHGPYRRRTALPRGVIRFFLIVLAMFAAGALITYFRSL